MISRLVMLCLIALLTVYYNSKGKQLLCDYIHVHVCDLMETQNIEAWLVLYRRHS